MSRGRARAILAMTGMDSPSQIEDIREDLGKLEGLIRVEFDFITDRVRVEYDPTVVTLKRIKETLSRSRNS